MKKLCPHNGKVPHESEEDALYELLQVVKKYPNYEGQVYFCMFCHFWHLGRKTEKSKKKRKRT